MNNEHLHSPTFIIWFMLFGIDFSFFSSFLNGYSRSIERAPD